jgi:diguanylate cyclase (GGDEF)-like protein
MKNRKPVTPFAPHEIRRFVLPLTLASIIVLLGLVIENALRGMPARYFIIACGILGAVYILVANLLIVRTSNLQDVFGWTNSILSGVGLGLLLWLLPDHLKELAHVLIVFGALAIATISGRIHAYLALLGTMAISLPNYLPTLTNLKNVLEYFTPIVISIVVLETIVRVKDTTQQQIHRLEMINQVSRQIMQSLDTEKTISLLDATIQNALEADSYYIGILKNGQIHLNLLYDDGEYFNGTCIPIDGTFAGWVAKNQRELFLPNLSSDVKLHDMRKVVIGKNRMSLSWVGVPLKAENITGVLALASYHANAFDRADLELLSSLAQHVTLALDNAIRHAQVEEQTRLDSLTGVYNHGYFLKRLDEQAEEAVGMNTPLSLIMMDIDYFKQYNDTFGHLVGDQILQSLCLAIKQHIKQRDAVGRWGGEEFAISLPGATGEQATTVAVRISETMATVRVEDREGHAVPVPTISQGIAVFP